MDKKKREYAIAGVLIFLALAIYIISSSYLFAPDEYNYSHIAWTDDKLSSIQDIITSQKSMYQQWTGRVPVHMTIQILLYLGTWLYQLINPIIMCIFIILLANMVYTNKSYMRIILALFLICFTIEGFGEKFVWLSGSINYLWTNVLMLAMMFFYYHHIVESKNNITIKQGIPLIILSFFSGWSQENVAFVLGSFIIIIAIIYRKKILSFDKKQKAWFIGSVIAFGMGAILLIFAPGNFNRLGTGETKIQFTNIITNFTQIKWLLVIYLISVIAIFLTKIQKDKKDNKKIPITKNQILFLLPMLIGLIPMCIISEFPTRAMLAYESMLIILVVMNVEYIKRVANLEKCIIFVNVVTTIAVVYMFTRNISIAEKYMIPYKEKLQTEINLAKIENQKDVTLSAFSDANQLTERYSDMLVNFAPTMFANHITNTYMAIYYGFDSIIAIQDNEYFVTIHLNDEIENISYPVINALTGEKIRESIITEQSNTTTHEISFLMQQQEEGIVKIELPENIKENIEEVSVKSVLKEESRPIEDFVE